MPDYLKQILLSHARNIFASLGDLCRTPFPSIFTVLVLGLTLALPTCLLLGIKNCEHYVAKLRQDLQMTIFLEDNINTSEQQRLDKILASLAGVKKVEYIPKEKAILDFEEQIQQRNLLQYLDENPLPNAYVLTLDSTISYPEIQELSIKLKELNSVTFLQDDYAWLSNLVTTLNFISRCVYLVAFLLCSTVLLIIANTTRLAMQTRQRHIIINKLIGATNSYILREFVYYGFWYGFFAAIVCCLTIKLSLAALLPDISPWLNAGNSEFRLIALDIKYSSLLTILSVALGMLGAWGSAFRQLSKLEPR